MKIQISTRHGQLSDAHQTQIMEKAERLLHFFERLTFLEIVVDLSGLKKTVEILGDAEHKHDFVASAEGDDVMAAMNGAKEKFKQQIKHYKERIQDHRRDPSHGGEEGIKS